MNSAQIFYQQKAEEYSIQLKAVSANLRRFAWFRFFAFLLIPAPALIFGLKSPLTFVVGAAALVLFLFLVKKNIQVEKRKKETAILKKLCEDELLALKHKYSHFKNGIEYTDPDHFYAYDLDLFGEGSLFQYLNRTVTVDGEMLLAKILVHPPFEKEEINERQQAIKELAQNPGWRLHFRATGLMFEESKELNLEIRAWTKTTLNLEKAGIINHLLWLIPLLTMVAAIPAILGISKLFLWVTIIIQWSLILFFSKQISFYFRYFGRKSALLEKYMALLEYIGKGDFKSEKLLQMKHSVIHPKPAGKTFSELKNWVNRFEYRQNIIVAFLLNSLLLWDIRCMFHLWRWHQQHHGEIAGWLDAIAAFDELITFGGFAGNHPGFVYPEVANDNFIFRAEQLGHPLLPQNKRVGNDFTVAGWSKAVIITGANMAGKSTFLRTVGINLILAETGAPVCAQCMVFTPVQLFTNMRTTDSLQKEESYFFAELKRIKRVLELLENGMPVFVILDEMLKGTNSLDKLNGSKELVKKLLQLPAVSFIATHDLKLSEMEVNFPEQVSNLCFEIKIESNEMVFDYKLSDGVTQTMNATFLMRKMGII
ncbi:MAG TPA: hypothetical protein DER09_13740 [Prolixibacteraceae bacterium]|nr:hypothetical protein [Prolixibacteraceae bacterium]